MGELQADQVCLRGEWVVPGEGTPHPDSPKPRKRHVGPRLILGSTQMVPMQEPVLGGGSSEESGMQRCQGPASGPAPREQLATSRARVPATVGQEGGSTRPPAGRTVGGQDQTCSWAAIPTLRPQTPPRPRAVTKGELGHVAFGRWRLQVWTHSSRAPEPA